jgi:Tfp pilus assembly protein PilX
MLLRAVLYILAVVALFGVVVFIAASDTSRELSRQRRRSRF